MCIEDTGIKWPLGDKKFLFERRKIYFSRSMRSRVNDFSTGEEKFRISKGPFNILYVHVRCCKCMSLLSALSYKHQKNTNPFYFNNFVLRMKGALYYVAIATVIFSQVKITC